MYIRWSALRTGTFAALMLGLCAAGSEASTLSITYNVPALAAIKNSRAPNSGTDTITPGGESTSAITLTYGTPVDEVINSINFSISATGSSQGSGPFNGSFSPTLNVTGPTVVSHGIAQNYSVTFNAGGNHNDTLSISAASAAVFDLGADGTLSVTPKALTIGPGAGTATLYGTFLLTPVPEPTSLAVLGLGTWGLLARRRA